MKTARRRFWLSTLAVWLATGGGGTSLGAAEEPAAKAPAQTVPAQPAPAQPALTRLSLGPTTAPEVGALAVDVARKRLYAGVRRHSADRLSLWVFDLDPQGQPTGRPRRFPDSLEPLAPGQWTWPTVFHLDAEHHRLYFGVSVSHPQTQATLGVYDLDLQGDPSGPLRSISSGNPQGDVQAIVPHPRLPRLYLVGWGHPALSHVDLDAAGHFVGPGVNQPVGGHGKYALAFDATGRRAYLGAYPSLLEVVDLDDQGLITGPARNFPLANGPQGYLQFASGPRGLYFRGPDQRLAWWPLDARGEPAAEPQLSVGPVIESLHRGHWSGGLLATVPQVETDVFTQTEQITGTHPVRIPLSDAGTPGQPQPLTGGPSDAQTTQLGLGTGVAAAVLPQPPQFRLNRTRGLALRATLHELEPDGILPPQVDALAVSEERTYLRFSLAPAGDRLYTLVGSELVTFDTSPAPSPPAGPVSPLAGSQALAAARRHTRKLESPAGQLALDASQRRLLSPRSSGELEVLPLDDQGLPVAPSTVWKTGLQSVSQVLAHPETGRVYVLGPSRAGESPDPQVIAIPSGESWQRLAIDPVRRRLYGITHYHGSRNLAVWTLDERGVPQDVAPRWYSDVFSREFRLRVGAESRVQPAISRRGTLSALWLDAPRRRLYVGGSPEQPQRGEGFIAVYSLDDQGDPRDEATALPTDPDAQPRVHLSSSTGSSPLALVGSPVGTDLWEAGWGDSRLFRWSRDARGELLGTPAPLPSRQHGKSELAFTPDGRQLFAGSWPAQLERIPCTPAGQPGVGAFAQLELAGKTLPLPFLAPGVQTDWMPLDEQLRDGIGRTVVRLVLSGGAVARARVTLEVRQQPPTGESRVKTFDMELLGSAAAVLIPRLGEPPGDSFWNRVESSSEYYERCRDFARAHAVPPEHRPEKFLIANGVIGIDANTRALEAGLEAVRLLGHNTVQVWGFAGANGSRVGERIRHHRLPHARAAIYNPPSYFDYDRPQVEPGFLENWASSQTPSLTGQGADVSQLALFHLADEPGWYFPAQFSAVTQSSDRLRVFHEYLRAQGLRPEDLGESSWEAVAPLGQATARQSVPRKRLHYWSTRFYAESLSVSFAAATAALQRQLNRRVLTTTNLNNWPGRFYIPSPGKPIANNGDQGPEAAMGMPDWFDLGRKHAVTCLWTEDWFADHDAGLWSLYADLLRSATRFEGLEFGGYVVGHSTGWSGLPDGGALKMLALVGHGAKVIDPYTFGPHAAFADGWSDSEARYDSIARGIELIGRAESLLHPGRPRPARVAIVFPQASQVWNDDARLPEYLHELYGLHAALVHSHDTVDFLDDVAIAAGRLQAGHYRAAYVSAPDLSLAAQRQLVDWTRQGGTLALLPGACGFDELHEPASLFTTELGAGPAHTVARKPALGPGELASHVPTELRLADDPRLAPVLPTELRLTTHGSLAPLTGLLGTTLVRNAAGEPLLLERKHGLGRVVQYGYWPGSSYWASPDRRDVTRLPVGWSARHRELATLPARLADTPRDVQVSSELTEAALLESEHGIAVTLLNWSGEPRPEIEVTVADVPFEPSRVRTARGAPVSLSRDGTRLRVKLPLTTVDVLMIEHR